MNSEKIRVELNRKEQEDLTEILEHALFHIQWRYECIDDVKEDFTCVRSVNAWMRIAKNIYYMIDRFNLEPIANSMSGRRWVAAIFLGKKDF